MNLSLSRSVIVATLIVLHVVVRHMGEGGDEPTLEGQTISKRPRFGAFVREIVEWSEELLFGNDDDTEEQ